MATIIIKNSATTGNMPSNLTQGELAINVKDGKLFYGSGSGNIVKEFTGSGGGGGAAFPYTGSARITGSLNVIGNTTITGSLNISGSTYLTDSIYFSGSGPASRLVWNDTDGTLDLGLKGGNVTLQIGQEQVIRVVNKTGANLLESEYKAVRIRRVDEGGAQGQRLAIVLAQADNDANSVDTLGLVTENINVNEEGFITNSGLVRGIDTTGTLQGETWVDGDPLYLSPTTSGSITKVKPQAPQHTITIGYVVYAHVNNGKIFVKVDNGYELDELHNVKITTGSLTSGDLLVYSSSVWINTKQLTGSYSLTGSLQATSFTGSLFGTASWATNALTASFITTASTNAFVQGGNSFGTTAVLGTNDNQSLAFETSGSTRMFISSSGNVGIGTNITSSAYRLQVDANGASNSSLPLALTSVDANNRVGILFASSSISAGKRHRLLHRVNTPTVEWLLGASAGETAIWRFLPRDDTNYAISMIIPYNGGTTYLTTGLSGSLFSLGAGSQTAQHINISSSGNVGIGTATPGVKLDVSGSARFTSNLTVTGSLIASIPTYGLNTSTGRLTSASIESLAWDTRFLIDAVGFSSIAWNDRTLHDSAETIRVDWNSGILSDAVPIQSINWEERALYDTGGNRSIHYGNRYLIYPDGTSPALDYSTQNQISMTGSVSVTGSLTVSGSSTFTNIGPAIFSGSVDSQGGFTGSLQGTASYAATASLLTGRLSTYRSFGTGSMVGTGTTSLTATTSFLIPANTFSTGDILRVRYRVRKLATNANTTTGIYINTTNNISTATTLGILTANTTSMQMKRDFYILAATGINTEHVGVGTSLATDDAATGRAASTINWAVDQYIIFGITHTNTNDSGYSTMYYLERV